MWIPNIGIFIESMLESDFTSNHCIYLTYNLQIYETYS